MSEFLNNLGAYLRTVDDLPTLPAVALDLEAALQNEAYGASEVAFIIEEDVSLSAVVLRAANSAYSASRGTIASVKEAVARLGFKEIERLTITISVIQAFPNQSGHLDYKEFWNHSLLVAFAARQIALAADTRVSFLEEEAHVSGLLHDVGVLILDQYFTEEFVAVATHMAGRGCTRAEAELAVLDTEHGEVGSYLLDIWNLPDDIVESVRWHHRVDEAPEEFKTQAQALAVADAICKIVENDESEEERAAILASSPAESLGLDGKALDDIIERVQQQKESAAALLDSV